MKNSITQYKFKPGMALEFEMLSVNDLYKKHKDILIAPHRSDFYNILWIHKGNGTHLVDFRPVKFSADSILFINKGRVHFFDPSEKFVGTLIIFTDNFFCREESDIRFLRSTILFHDLLDNAALRLREGKDVLYSILQLMKTESLQSEKKFNQDVLQNYLQNFLMLADREKRKQGFTEISKGADLDYTMLFNELLDKHFKKVGSVKEQSHF